MINEVTEYESNGIKFRTVNLISKQYKIRLNKLCYEKKEKRHFYHKHFNRPKKMFKLKNITLRLINNNIIKMIETKLIKELTNE
jgi:hypothetical protein